MLRSLSVFRRELCRVRERERELECVAVLCDSYGMACLTKALCFYQMFVFILLKFLHEKWPLIALDWPAWLLIFAEKYKKFPRQVHFPLNRILTTAFPCNPNLLSFSQKPIDRIVIKLSQQTLIQASSVKTSFHQNNVYICIYYIDVLYTRRRSLITRLSTKASKFVYMPIAEWERERDSEAYEVKLGLEFRHTN